MPGALNRRGLIRLLRLFLCALSFCCFLPTQGLAQERIRDFACSAQVRANGSVRITERITLVAEGRNIRRGIVRDLPLAWSDGKQDYRLKITLESVRRDGRHEPISLSRESDMLSVRIGDPDALLPRGEHVYAVTYLVANVLTSDGASDEFYWNATGRWDFPIERARCSLELPDAAQSLDASGRDSRIIEINAYTGETGGRGRDFRIRPDGGVETTATLREGEGLTVSYTWPTGLTGGIAQPRTFATFLRQSLLPGPSSWRMPLIPLVALLLLLWFWRRHGRDPLMPVIIPRFEAPKNATPGLTRAIRRLGWDETCLVADILSLAAKGYLEVAPGTGNVTYVLRRIPAAPDAPELRPELLKDEQDLLEKLLPTPDSILALHSSNHAILSAARTLSRIRCAGPLGKLNTGNTGWLLLGLLPLLLLPFTIYSGAGPDTTIACCAIYGIGAAITAVAHKRAQKNSSQPGKAGVIITVLALLIFLIVGSLFAFVITEALSPPPAGWLGMGFLGLLLGATFARLMPRRTEAGVQTLAEIEGLVQYLSVAEQHRLEALYPPADTIERFELLLPYALALDTAETWADRFDAYLQKISMPPPRSIAFAAANRGWPRTFNRTMRSMGRIYSASAINPAARQPGSGPRSFGGSGRGGGGFSGGGRGGGGGRGW